MVSDCAIEPLIDHQTFNFLEFDLVNFSPYNHVFFSSLIIGFKFLQSSPQLPIKLQYLCN
jgi:hypothetical protein